MIKILAQIGWGLVVLYFKVTLAAWLVLIARLACPRRPRPEAELPAARLL